MNVPRQQTREIPSTSTENQWIIENPATENDNAENGVESNGNNEPEQNYYVEEDGENEESMVVEATITGDDEESLEEVSAEPIYSNPNSDEEEDVGEGDKSRDNEELEEEEEDASQIKSATPWKHANAIPNSTLKSNPNNRSDSANFFF